MSSWTRDKLPSGASVYTKGQWVIKARLARQPVQGSQVFGQWVGHSDRRRVEHWVVEFDGQVKTIAFKLSEAKAYVERVGA